jgi:hypothetical protein
MNLKVPENQRLLTIILGQIGPKFEDKHLSNKFSAEMEFFKMDPWNRFY